MPDTTDPRYPRRYQRGGSDEPENPAALKQPSDDDVPAPSWRLPAWTLLVVAGVLIGVAASAVAWSALDPGMATGMLPGISTAHRAVARLLAVAGGPLLVAGVLALTAWAVIEQPRHPVAALAVPGGATLVSGVAGFAIAFEIARLDGLVAPGRVSSGGIPLSPENLVIYLARVQADAVLVELLPWLIAATAIAVVGTVIAVVIRR